MEINMGSFENQPWSQCRWVIDPRVGARATPFPGPGGESLEDVLSRASNMVDFLLQSDFATVLIVSHGMFLKEFLHALCIRAGCDVSWQQAGWSNTGITVIGMDKENAEWRLKIYTINDIGHLHGGMYMYVQVHRLTLQMRLASWFCQAECRLGMPYSIGLFCCERASYHALVFVRCNTAFWPSLSLAFHVLVSLSPPEQRVAFVLVLQFLLWKDSACVLNKGCINHRNFTGCDILISPFFLFGIFLALCFAFWFLLGFIVLFLWRRRGWFIKIIYTIFIDASFLFVVMRFSFCRC